MKTLTGKNLIVVAGLAGIAILIIFGIRMICEEPQGSEPLPSENGKTTVQDEPSEAQLAQEILRVDAEKGFFVLVNKEHAVDSSYVPSDLASVKYFATDRSEAGRYMREEAANAFHQLAEAAELEGHTIVVTTAYRDYNFQKMLYENYVKSHGQEEADTFSAQPGKSEHQTGLAADVSSPSVDYQLTEEYINTPEGKWLSENAHKFGFIIRFPKGSEDITGYMYEPWHIRYVGKTAAKMIFDKGITLEEFLEEEN